MDFPWPSVPDLGKTLIQIATEKLKNPFLIFQINNFILRICRKTCNVLAPNILATWTYYRKSRGLNQRIMYDMV
jgi:hypothetical protein